MSRTVIFLAGLCGVVLSGCGPREEPIDVVLLVIDSTPAAAVRSHPGFDPFLRRGVHFTDAYSVSGDPETAFASILSGRFPSGPPAPGSLPRAMAAAGRTTLALETLPSRRAAAWGKDFQTAVDADPTDRLAALRDALAGPTPLFAVVRLDRIDRVGTLLEEAATLLDDRQVAWALTAAIGNPAAGELAEDRLRVPLIAHAPGERPGDVSRMAQIVDLHPTALRWIGVDPGEPPGQGVDLAVGRQAVFCESGPRRSLRRGRFKIVAGGDAAPKLHDLTGDPGENEDRADEPDWGPIRNELLQHLADTAAWIAGEARPLPEETGTLDPATLEELRSLGYLR